MKGCKDCGYASEGTYLKDGRCDECIAKVYQPVQESKMSEKIGAVPVYISEDGFVFDSSYTSIPKGFNGVAMTHSQLREYAESIAKATWESATGVEYDNVYDYVKSPEFQKALGEGLV